MKPLFNSYSFIFVFLPVLTAGFYLIPAVAGSFSLSARKWFLIFVSLVFYACFGWRDFLIFAAGILINGFLACAVSELAEMRERNKKGSAAGNSSAAAQDEAGHNAAARAKAATTAGVILNIGFLAFFKYAGYLSFRGGSIVMPLAISFYTFQQISFLLDVYRGEIRMKVSLTPRTHGDSRAEVPGEPLSRGTDHLSASFSDYLLYITYFPKLLEGPIVRFGEMRSQFDRMGETRFDGERVLRGMFLFTLGLAKKVLLADTIAGAVDYGFSVLPRVTWLDALVVMFGYTLQLYLDFSGYCDMGAGVSRMIGIDLPENFHLPYKARNIAEFWERWHMTLSRFFTKYLYIPLGGNRKGRARTYLNIMIVFLVSGIWHGAGWTFLVWGFMHGALSVVQRALADSRSVSRGAWKQGGKGTSLSEGKQGGSGEEKYGNAADPVVEKHGGAARRLWQMICTALTFVYVSAAWMFFRADSVKQPLDLLKIAFSKPWFRCSIRLAKSAQLDEVWYALKVLHLDGWKYSGYICMWLVLAVSAAIAFAPYTFREISERHRIRGSTYFVIAILFAWCVISLGGVSTFLYFKF